MQKVVEFIVGSRTKCFYVGKVIGTEGDAIDVSFLRASKKRPGKFVDPPVPDFSSVKRASVRAVLPKPVPSGQTKRQQAYYSFPVEFVAADIR